MSILINPARFRLGADTAIGRLLGDEPAGMVIDFTTMQALVRDDSFPVTGFLGGVNSLLTYTAPSPKRVYDVAGTLGYGPHNLLLRSQEFDNAAWTALHSTVTANAGVAPDGTSTADKSIPATFSSNVHGLYKLSTTVVSAASYVYSVYAKTAGYNGLQIVGHGATDAWSANFNLSTGVVNSAGASAAGSIQNAGNGWYRCSIRVTSNSTSGDVRFYVCPAANLAAGGAIVAYVGDGVSGVLLWGAQLECNVSPSTYIPTTTAVRYGLPLDHHPVTHVPLGVLVEEQRVNLLLRSEEFDNVAWTKDGSTITANAVASPDGTVSADKAVETATSAEHRFYVSVASPAGVVTMTIYAKAAERSWISIQSNAANANAGFNLATGAIGTVGAGATAAIQSVGNGWYRCSMKFTSAGSNFFIVRIGSADTYSYAGNGTSGLYVWGAQLEAGAFATSYIATTTAQVTRAMDNITLPTAQFPLSATAGTVAWNGDVAGTGHLWALSDGTANERYVAYLSSNVPTFIVVDGGAAQASLGDGSIVPPSACKLATGWALNDIAMSRDGRAVVTDASATLPTVTSLKFGLSETNTLPLTGHIKTMKYLPRRASNAELVGMSL